LAEDMLGYARIIGLGTNRARRGRANPTYVGGRHVGQPKIPAPSQERDSEL